VLPFTPLQPPARASGRAASSAGVLEGQQSRLPTRPQANVKKVQIEEPETAAKSAA
jgi:hypothetical protein